MLGMNTYSEFSSPIQDVASHSQLQPLLDREIDSFFKELDKDEDGLILISDLKASIAETRRETALAAESDQQTIQTERRFSMISRRLSVADPEKTIPNDPERDGLDAFMTAMLPGVGPTLNKQEFSALVRKWNVPSQTQTTAEHQDAHADEYEKKLTWFRSARAYWSVNGSKIIFATFVACLTCIFSMWQGLEYYYDETATAALGAGVIVAKFAAGALYPVLFFLLLSMSRWFSTLMRRYPVTSRFVNWDRSQSFHIKMALIALFFATMHAIGHLAGSFVSASDPAHQPAVREMIHAPPSTPPLRYVSFLQMIPGWTGLMALGMFYMIAILSLPAIRRNCYEVFQAGHLLMFPFMGLLCAHGALKLLQYPMLGFWVAGPLLFVALERGLRVARNFIWHLATIEVLDKDTVNVVVKHPRGDAWPCYAGQYVLLLIPDLSLFQWHPFTVSACIGDVLQLHIKTDGNWTGRLRDLASTKKQYINVSLDGPFGAPAQRFYNFDRTLIIGSGIGITPFSAILTDLELKLAQGHDPWELSRVFSGTSTYSVNRPPRPASSESLTELVQMDSKAASVYSLRASPEPPSSPGLAPMRTLDSRPSNPGQRPLRQVLSRHNSPPVSRKLLRPLTFRNHSAADDKRTASRKRVDFHWLVREQNSLLWFSSLLNRVHDLAATLDRNRLELNITAHVTAKKKDVATHVFRYLLDAYRTPSAPCSVLTGLKGRSEFGRPNFKAILESYYKDEVVHTSKGHRGKEIGVFFCGSPHIGRVLADVCAELTAKGRADGSKIRFVFMMEVFG